MKVAILSHTYLEPENRKNIHALAELAEVLVIVPRRFDVLVFDEVVFEQEEADGSLFLPLGAVRLFGAEYLLRSATLGFSQFRPDVIHVHYNPWSTVFWQAVIARRLFSPRARLVCTIKMNTYRAYPGLAGWLKARIRRAGVRRVSRFLAASHASANLCENQLGAPRQKIDVVAHLGLDGATFSPAPSSGQASARPPVVGFCGRLSEHKGLKVLFEAAERARNASKIDLQLRLLGAGPLEPWLRERRAGSPWLQILEPVRNSEVPAFLRGLDVFVMPSLVLSDHEEHDGHAIMEAMAVGLPIIGARSGIIPELLCDGGGVVVEPDSVSELADALIELCRNHHARRRLGLRARAIAERDFLLSTVAEQTFSAYGRA